MRDESERHKWYHYYELLLPLPERTPSQCTYAFPVALSSHHDTFRPFRPRTSITFGVSADSLVPCFARCSGLAAGIEVVCEWGGFLVGFDEGVALAHAVVLADYAFEELEVVRVFYCLERRNSECMQCGGKW
jgi:hypothetical protein